MAKKLTKTQREYQKKQGLWFTVLVAAFVAFMWSGIFGSLMAGHWRIWVQPLLMGVPVVLGVWGFVLRRAYPLPRGVELPYFSSGWFWFKFYFVIAVEFAAIFLFIRVLRSHGVPEGLFPLIVFVVSAHFFPLAKLNGNPIWYVPAASLCLIIVVLVALVPHAARIAPFGQEVSTWSVVSIGAMVAGMLLTSFAAGILYRRAADN